MVIIPGHDVQQKESGGRKWLLAKVGFTKIVEYFLTEFCLEIKCSVFQSPPNTFIRCLDGNNYGSICYFVGCQAGYETPISRKNFVMCGSDSRWKGSISRCQSISNKNGFLIS